MSVEYRAGAAPSVTDRTIKGRAIEAGTTYRVGSWFQETFSDECRYELDESWILHEHDPARVVASTRSNTLKYTTTPEGHLEYEADVVASPSGDDVLTLITRGDITGSSVGFIPIEERWIFADNPADDVRVITAARIVETSVTILPMNPGATVGKRSMSADESDPEALHKAARAANETTERRAAAKRRFVI